MAINPTKVRDRWGTKLYETFQRNADDIYTEGDEAGALGYKFQGTKFDGGIEDVATVPDPDPIGGTSAPLP